MTKVASGEPPTQNDRHADDKTTTTLSTIAVRAGVNASIVVALLKSTGYIHLRIDEMHPALLSIGSNSEETSGLLSIHDDLMNRLALKEDQVEQLLARTNDLGSEKTDPKEAIVYRDMGVNLTETWRSLNRQLLLRGYLLRETLHFYTTAEEHDRLTNQVKQLLQQLTPANLNDVLRTVEEIQNEVIDKTALAMDLGASVLSQIRVLGQVDDNPERPQEMLNLCVQIETIMFRIAASWELTEEVVEKGKRGQIHQTTTEFDELTVVEQWLTLSERKVKALNETGQKQVLNEGNKHLDRLRELAQTPSSEGGRVSHLSGRIEEFLHYLKTKMGRSGKIQGFLQNAKSTISQLEMMTKDVQNANAAMAGELVPLAKQKTLPLLQEGKEILAKEHLTYEEQRLVKQLLEELDAKLIRIIELAKERATAQKTNSEIERLNTWLEGPATAFLGQKGDIGGNLNDAREFVSEHKQFATDILNFDASLMQLLSQRNQFSAEENERLNEFVKKYEQLKTTVENRIQLGSTYEQVHKFAKDVESSFDALQTLLVNNQDYTNEKIKSQIANVFQMVKETLTQEKHQGQKFCSNAVQIAKGDKWIKIDRAEEAVRNLITDHENRLQYVTHKWNEWQRSKDQASAFSQTIEVVEMWQEDVLDFIAKTDRRQDLSKQETEEIVKKIEGLQATLEDQTQTVEELRNHVTAEEQLSRISVTLDKQDYIEGRLEQIKNRVGESHVHVQVREFKLKLESLLRVVEEVQMWQEETVEIIRNISQVITTSVNNHEQLTSLKNKIHDLKEDVLRKNEHLLSLRDVSNNEIYQSRVDEVISRQEQINRSVEQLDEQIEVSQLLKTVEDVQMWQEEAVEIIRIFETTKVQNVKEAQEIVDKIHELKTTVEEKTRRISEMRQVSHAPAYQQKIDHVEHRQHQIAQLVQQVEEKLEQQLLLKKTEEIQMWQEEMVEIIKIFDSVPVRTEEERKELTEKVDMVKKTIEVQNPTIDEIVRSARDDTVKKQVAQIIERQHAIREMATSLEKKTLEVSFYQPEERHEETKTIELETFETSQLTVAQQEQLRTLKKIVEEIQMWQEETIEIIRLIEKTPEAENVVQRVEEIKQTVENQTQKLSEAQTFKHDESFSETVQITTQKQQQIQQLIEELNDRAHSQRQLIQANEVKYHVRAPQILKQLESAVVEKGTRFEFAARIEGEPEPNILWMKDGIDVKSNIDYRQEYINGVATFVIEECFLEDTATYTVRATNEGGQAESSANLIVQTQSAKSSVIMEEEEEKPRFVKQLQNVQVTEGATANLSCVVVGRPEPEVAWFKEEVAVREDERVHLQFTGDKCQMTIEKTVPVDSGMYTARAKNVHGEVQNFCQLKVAPKRPLRQAQLRAPTIQPTLTNTTWQEGESATLKIFTQGSPRPHVQWKFNDIDLQTTRDVRIDTKEDGWSTLTIHQISPVHAGMYTVVAENEAGEAVTGATVHVQPTIQQNQTSTTLEHHFQEELDERIGQPIQKTVITKKQSEFDERNRHTYSPVQPAPITDEKRWVEVIEQHFEEHLSQASMSPIPQTQERRRIETQQRWVDTIDEIWSPEPVERQVKETNINQRVDHYSAHTVHEPSPKPTYHATSSSERTQTMNAAAIRKTPQPESHNARTTPAPTNEYVAAIRKTPVPESHSATMVRAPSVENVAKIRQSPVPEVHSSTLTRRTTSVENVAKIRQSPVPEIHSSTLTRRSPSVENVAKIRQSPAREVYNSTLTRRSPSVENVAKIRQSPAPEVYSSTITRGSPSVENAAKIRQSPAPEIHSSRITGRSTVENVGTIRQSPAPEKYSTTLTRQSPSIENIATIQPGTEREVHHASTVGGQPVANIAQVHTPQRPIAQDIQRSETKIDRIQDIVILPQEDIVTTTVKQTVETVQDVDTHEQHQEQKYETTKSVKESVEGEGWVQHQHQDFINPQNTTTTVKKLDIDETERIHHQNQTIPSAQKTVTEQKLLEETERQQKESRIPVRTPKTTKTVTETTSGEGWVQDVHQDFTKAPHTSQVTVKRLDIDEEERIKRETQTQNQNLQETHRRQEDQTETLEIQKSHIPVKTQPKKTVTETTTTEGWVQHQHEDQTHALTTTTKKLNVDQEQFEARKYEEEETAGRQRDSFAMASEAEGFWTDGAYTASPTPPPVPVFQKSTAESNMQRIGLSRTTTEPEFIKSFKKEYTVEENGRLTIECVLVGNPRPKTRFFFNDRQITSTNSVKITNVNDTYLIQINNATLEHAGFYKIIAENKRGITESLTVVHVRPRALQSYRNEPTEHTTVEEEFAMFEYEQKRPLKHESTKQETPPPAKRLQQTHKSDDEHLELYEMEGHKPTGHPPHFTQTLISTVAAAGESTKFEGIVTGWPAPTVEWTVDGHPINTSTGALRVSNIGGRVSLAFSNCEPNLSGKYMCTAKNASGVATSSAQLVVRPKTVAPDFIQRLISEEVEAGETLKWSVRVTGDPMPTVKWMRDGFEIPDCDEVRLLNEGNGIYTLVIVKVEPADSGQFTCVAENIAGEARSTADLVVRSSGAEPGNYFHVTKVTQEKQTHGEEPIRTSTFAVETPKQSDFI